MKKLTQLIKKITKNSKRNNSEKYNSHRFGLRHRLTQFVCAALITCILTVSVPAAPLEIKASLGELHQDIRYSLLSSNFAAGFSGWTSSLLLFISTKKQETQSIGRIEILPGDTTRRQGEPINFSAIGFTTDGRTAGGLKFKWTIKDAGRNLKEHNLANGNFQAQTPGTFVVTAEAESVSAQVNIVVEANTALMTIKRLKRDEERGNLTEINKLKAKKMYSSESISSKRDYKDKNKEKDAVASAYYEPKNAEMKKARGPNARDTNAEYEGAESAESAPTAPAPAAMMRPIDEPGWNSDNWYTADDPGNQVGNPPGTSPDAGAGNGNFQMSAPVLSLPGRGIDLNLALNYNSRLWSKSGDRMSYDSDKGFPAPGWSLGFGKMMYVGPQGGCMMLDADGTRHGYSGTAYNYTPTPTYATNDFSGRTADGTFIDYNCRTTYNNGVSTMSASATLPNGTTIQYGTYDASGHQSFPTQITDAQGNYINISYRNNRGPQIQTVTDTMGRFVNFNYDSLNRLISVTTHKMGNVGTRTVVQIHYKQITLNPGFASGITTDTNQNYPYVIDAIYYPGTGTGYWFNDVDSYSSYGMIAKVVEQRGMSWSAAGEEQGTISPGTMSKQAIYNYPLSANYSLTDAPTYSTLTESWAGMDDVPAVTSYNIQSNSTPQIITVTQPNGVRSEQTSYNRPGLWDDGLIYQDRTLDAAGNELSKSVVEWQQGAYDTARPKVMQIIDERGQTLKTVNDYGTSYNQLISQKEYDYNGTTVLKETRTSYENNSAYINRHIFGLVKTNELFDGAGNRVTRIDYQYDNNVLVTGTQNHNLKETPGVTMHLATADPYTSETVNGACVNGYFNHQQCSYEGETVSVYQPGGGMDDVTCFYECTEYEQVSAYDPNTIFRGNVTKITGYADVKNDTVGEAISQTKQYDNTGNLVAESASCCQLKTYLYDDPKTLQIIDTQYAYPVIQTRGSSHTTSTVKNTVSTVYDFYTGLVKELTDENNRTLTNQYNADNLRPVSSTAPTGAYSQTVYDEATMMVTSQIYEADGNIAGQSINHLNGVGQVIKQKTLGANGIYDIVETKYDNLGRIWKQSNPYRVTETDRWWTVTTYDLLSRTKTVTSPEGSLTQAFYNEDAARPNSATALPGSTTRLVDEWGRERWGRFDAQDRLVEVIEPNPNSNGTLSVPGSQPTKYTYDTLGNLTETEQIEMGQITQHRYLKYDSLGRMTRQKMAEQTATLNDAGNYVVPGQSGAVWSEAYVYDKRSNMTRKTDARGVRANFVYGNIHTGDEDPLNRLRTIYYDTTAPAIPGKPIYAGYTTEYEYEPTGDQNRLKKAASGLSKDEYTYDDEGRVKNYTQTVVGRESYPLTTTTLYDTLDRVKELRYPNAYGLAGDPRKIVQQSYDVASRLSALTVDGQQQVGNVLFNATGQTTSINIGAPGANQVNENYAFDPQTGLLTNQKVQQGSQTLLDLSYDYNRNTGSSGTLNGKTGHLSKILDNKNHARDRSYEYDALGRLTKAQGGVNKTWTQQYAYDRFGNRESVTATGVDAYGSAIPSDGIPTLTYDKNTNRITTGIHGQFEYDEAGNQTRAWSEDGQRWLRYEYDTANRMVAVKRDDGSSLQGFLYGPSGSRLMNHDYTTGEFIIYVDIGGTTLSEYREFTQSVPKWRKSYTYLGGAMLSTISNVNGSESVEYNHPDRLGTRTITNQQTGTGSEQTTLPFGTTLDVESSVTNNKNRFTSYDRSNATGLDYAVNRSYDSKQGRFTQVDPIGMGASSLDSPQTLNLYSYCGNDPINHTDPSGLFWGAIGRFFKKAWNFIKVAVAVIAAVVAIVVAIYVTAGAAGWAISGFIAAEEGVKFGVMAAITAIAGAGASVYNAVGAITNSIRNRGDDDDDEDIGWIDENGVYHPPGEQIRINTRIRGILNIAIAGIGAGITSLANSLDSKSSFIKCFKKYHFSKMFFGGTRFQAAAEFVEIGSEVLLVADGIATARKWGYLGKVTRTAGNYQGASSINWGIRKLSKIWNPKIGKNTFKFVAQKYVSKINPVLAGVGVITAAYNVGVGISCGTGLAK